jgi:hypothetical protein
MTKIDWNQHVATYRAGSQSVAAYCAAAGIKLSTFQYHLYKRDSKRSQQPKHFQEFHVATELVITRASDGTLLLSGFDVTQLPVIVGAWSNALS